VLFADFTSLASWLTERALQPRIVEGTLEVERRALESAPPGRPLPAGAMDPDPVLVRTALEEGLRIAGTLPRVRTRKAHEAVRFAEDPALRADLVAALYAAYWEEGMDLGRIDVLVAIGERVGLDPFALKVALDIDLHTGAVEEDRRVATAAGVARIPTLVLDTHPPCAAAGPLTAEVLSRLLEAPRRGSDPPPHEP
jgi:predicted DsbA family dithiol-disulfide isomerase